MTQGQTAPVGRAAPSAPATAPVAAPSAAPGRPQGLPGQVGRRLLATDTPGLLNRLQLVAVAICVGFAVLSALVQFLGNGASGRAADNTEQLVRVQQIQTDLLHADAVATNAFLVGGIEPAETRAEYDETVAQLLGSIADAAEAQPADRAALAELNQLVNDYTTGVTQARDNNRQGYPVGTQYLSDASQTLREAATPILTALVTANSDRTEDEMGGQHPIWLLVLGVLALAGLFWVNRQLATRFRRRFNVGLLAAAVAITVMSLVSALHAANRVGDNNDLKAGAYQDAVNVANARTAANNAKANESLRLINRGSGDTYEAPWREAAASVVGNNTRPLQDVWSAYATAHKTLVEADDAGSWEAAVQIATTDEGDGTTALFDAYDTQAGEEIDSAAREATDTLRQGGVLASILAALTLLAGLFAAGAATWGVNQRRREYS